MSITSDMIRGHTDTIILAHLMGGDSYGYEINKSILRKTGGAYELKEATLYSAFRRLEQDGVIASYWGNENTGARRRYYAITPRGRDVYGAQLSDWKRSRAIIDQLITVEDK